MKPSTARHKADHSADPLIALLRASGVEYEGLGGTLDGFAWLGNAIVMLDFKTGAKAKRTPKQIALVARGAPIWFLATDDDVLQVVRWLKAQRRQIAV